MLANKRKRIVGPIIWGRKTHPKDDNPSGKDEEGWDKSGLFQPSVYHALIVIFLEFFSWGLLMSPAISVLNETFNNHAFLMNGLIQGVKGFLSFLAAPLIGALSDVWGRKPFLLLTVTFTCAPIPLMKFSPWWYFAMISISGIFSVTFSIVFAYVADVTTEEDRSAAYGLVSATFAASLVTSPSIGAYLESVYSENLVIALATAVALFDVFFILVAVPESLSDKLRPSGVKSQMSWEKADPFGALKRLGHDYLILMLCVTVFLSYLPEAGEYTSFFVYLRLVIGFSKETSASFVAFIGVLSVFAQTALLALLMRYLGSKNSIIFGLVFEMLQLLLLGFGSQSWVIWMAGGLAAMGSITYPAMSAFVSAHTDEHQQGVAQGMVTGIRGLCNGLGPALFGLIFYLFHVDLTDPEEDGPKPAPNISTPAGQALHNIHESIMPGPPFAFGAILVILALLVAVFIPEDRRHETGNRSPTRKSPSTQIELFHRDTGIRIHDTEPLLTEITEDET